MFCNESIDVIELGRFVFVHCESGSYQYFLHLTEPGYYTYIATYIVYKSSNIHKVVQMVAMHG